MKYSDSPELLEDHILDRHTSSPAFEREDVHLVANHEGHVDQLHKLRRLPLRLSKYDQQAIRELQMPH